MSCGLAHLDGAYVLGSLSPGERREFERHLGSCSTCAESVRELAGLPGLLARLDLEEVEATVPAGPVPDSVLPALVDQVRKSQRRRKVGLAVAGLAAAAAVVTSLAVGGVVGWPSEREGTQGPSAAESSAPSRRMTQVDDGPLSASVALEDVAWGTRLNLVCAYAEAGGGGYGLGGDSRPAYSLVVTTVDGESEQVATWQAVPGGTMSVTGATSHVRGDIASVEVRTEGGEPVLRLKS